MPHFNAPLVKIVGFLQENLVKRARDIRQQISINDYLLIIMHINLNSPGQQFLQLSPLFEQANYAPSPLLSPDQLSLPPPNQLPQFTHFSLEQDQELLQLSMIAARIDDLSPPIPHPSNRYMLDPDEKSEGYEMPESQDHPLPFEPRRECPLERAQSTQVHLPPLLAMPNGQLPPIRDIIEFLVENSRLDEQTLLEHSAVFSQGNELIDQVFSILAGKFKKLRKTKQEMTKYCMRKAFKFIADRMRRDRTHNRDVDTCMKLYFAKAQTGSPFSIPFKKNSVEKTMNGNFLKRIFASQAFVEDYREFLKQFQLLMAEDNEKKIAYLADVLEKYIKNNDIKKIEAIKRLPWTRETLVQTEQLGMSLMGYADGKNIRLKDQ